MVHPRCAKTAGSPIRTPMGASPRRLDVGQTWLNDGRRGRTDASGRALYSATIARNRAGGHRSFASARPEEDDGAAYTADVMNVRHAQVSGTEAGMKGLDGK